MRTPHTATRDSPCLPQLEKRTHSSEDPGQSINKYIKLCKQFKNTKANIILMKKKLNFYPLM